MAIDVTHMEPPALEAAKLDAVKKAKGIIDDLKGRMPANSDPYRAILEAGNEEALEKYKGFMGDAQIIETEIGRRKEADGLRQFTQLGSRNGDLAKMFMQEGQPGDDDAVPPEGAWVSPGVKFVTSDIYRRLQKDGAFRHEPNSRLIPEFGVKLGFESAFPVHRRMMKMARILEGRLREKDTHDLITKDLIWTSSGSGGAWVIPEYQMDEELAARPTPDILSILPVQQTQTDTIYWLQQVTRSTAATAVNEATTLTGTEGRKPESAMAWTRKTTNVETIAVWVAVTNQQLGDAAEIRAVIDRELRDDLDLQLDYQLLQGGGTSPNLTGLLNAGIQSLTYSTATHKNIANAMLAGVVQIMTANEPEPNFMGLNPVQWYVYATMSASGSGEYLAGPPTASGPRVMWGYPLLVSNRIPNQKGVVGNSTKARLHMREDSVIRVGFVDDDFINNRIRVLGELRAALTVRRPNAFIQVTALPTS